MSQAGSEEMDEEQGPYLGVCTAFWIKLLAATKHSSLLSFEVSVRDLFMHVHHFLYQTLKLTFVFIVFSIV